MTNWNPISLSNGKYAFKNINGTLSQEFLKVSKFSCGYAVVQLLNGFYAFFDEFGNVDGEFLYACGYVHNQAVVITKDGAYHYRNTKKELTIPFIYAGSFSNNYGLVKLGKNRWAYINSNWELSDEFPEAYTYFNGYGKVRLANKQIMYRDIFGNLSKRISLLGEQASKYNNGEIDEYHLADDSFANEHFLSLMIKRITLLKNQAIEASSNLKELSETKEYYSNLTEYIKDKAYEVHNQTKQNPQNLVSKASNKLANENQTTSQDFDLEHLSTEQFDEYKEYVKQELDF